MIRNLLLSSVAMLEGAERDEGYNQLHLLHCSSILDTCCPRDLFFLQAYLHGYLFKEGCRWHSLLRGAKPQFSYFSLSYDGACWQKRKLWEWFTTVHTSDWISSLLLLLYSLLHYYLEHAQHFTHTKWDITGRTESSLLGLRTKLQWISNPSPW